MRPFDSIDTLTEQVIAAAIRVHDTFGPGLLESVYRRALVIELVARDIPVEAEKSVPLLYRGQNIGDGFKLDILVNGILVVEVKAVERILPVHLAQVITYLKVTRCPAGLLLNFNTTSLRSGGLRRLDLLIS